MTTFVIHTKPDGGKDLRSYEGMSQQVVEKLSAEYEAPFEVVQEDNFKTALEDHRGKQELVVAEFHTERLKAKL